MQTVKSTDELKTAVSNARKEGKTIGFVPTMGALHRGHISLVERSKRDTGFTVVSIFVNPTQFGPGEDYNKYPRDIEKDSGLLEQAGADILFFPEKSEMYPEGFSTWVEPGEPAKILEGERRPGHFRGVCTVVLKLFERVNPDAAFFGQKDAQQFAVLDRMVIDFNMPVQMVECPIVRDDDGLALSSRNAYLNETERKAAVIYHKALLKASELIEKGERKSKVIIENIQKKVETEPLARLDYADIVQAGAFTRVSDIEGTIYILIAGFMGTTRLIDNIKITLD